MSEDDENIVEAIVCNYYGMPVYMDKFLLCYDDDGNKFLVPIGTGNEKLGGTFSPACSLCSFDDILLFGCTDGAVSCFNTDKRGCFTDDEKEKFSADDEILSKMIPAKYYSHLGHSYTSGCTTKSDNCGIPHFFKNTVPKSCVIKIKNMQNSRFYVSVLTNNGGGKDLGEIIADNMSFQNVDFGYLSFQTSKNTICPVPEREKKWVEKQYQIYSNKHMRPFGIYGISYSYTVAGRIKK